MIEIRHVSGTVSVLNGANTTTLVNTNAYTYISSNSGLAIRDFANEVVVTFVDLGDLSLFDEGAPIATPGTFLDLSNQLQEWLAPLSANPFLLNFEYSLSTGLLYGGKITVDVDDKVNIDAGSGQIVDHVTTPGVPSIITVVWPEMLGVVMTNVATNPFTVLLISDTGAVLQQTDSASNIDMSTKILLGSAIHTNFVSVTDTTSTVSLASNIGQQVNDLYAFIGFASKSGNAIVANGANLKLHKLEGVGISKGREYYNIPNDPNTVSMSDQNPSTFFRILRDNTFIGAPTEDLDPAVYDDGTTTPATVPSNTNATIKRAYIFPDDNIVIQEGQEVFSNFSDAVTAAENEQYVVAAALFEQALLLARIVMTKNCASLQDATRCQIILAGNVNADVIFT